MSQVLETVDCSHIRAHLDCSRVHALLVPHLDRSNPAAAVTAAAPNPQGLGRRTQVCLEAARSFEIVYERSTTMGWAVEESLQGRPAVVGWGEASQERQVLLAAEAGRRLLLPRIRPNHFGSPAGWIFEPPPPGHELLRNCAGASAASQCTRVARRLLSGRVWLCTKRISGGMYATSCVAVADAWLAAVSERASARSHLQ